VTCGRFIFLEETMLDIQTQLLEGRDIRLGPIDHETHPEIESKWTHEAGFMRLMDFHPARPLSPAMVKKRYESIEKKMEEEKNLFYFTIRARPDDRLIGKAMIEWINWSNSQGWLWLGIGETESRRKGYGSQTLAMLVRYAFAELNLFRVSAALAEYNEPALQFFRKSGFVEETRRREALHRDNRRWDLMSYGLLRSEWEQHVKAGGA
jgi:RimJ/RimL family protein N-acetyltransferase